ncbi:MAG TPA: serine/threonine-protein kinase [Kofleriaceae bacterium]|nr:serine/threonine-protein kinase [Kofleriaceae bacterium]
MPNPTPGTILGAYRVEGQLGAGSMGEVFKGVDTGLNRKVAIKILSEKHRDSPELRQRFVREGRAVAAISHPNVVQVFATGTFDDRPYIAMELLDGTDLGSIVEKNGPLSSAEAAHAILDAAQGLAAASKAGLIHRDVKPSNLVRLSSNEVKVTDFGLAKPVDPGSEPALTAMGVVVGTPDYIAPEQARGETIDERVDIYALGGTMYFLLTGIPPFRTGKPAEDKYLKVVARHLRNPAPDAATTNPSVDRELANLTKRMMAKKPGERPSYQELIEGLTTLLARIDPGSVPQLIATSRERSRPFKIPPDAGPGASLPEGGATLSDGELAAVPRAGLPSWLVVFSLLCVALFVAGLVVYLQRGGDEPASPTPGSGSTAIAGSAAVVTPDAPPAPKVPPAGMILVKLPDGNQLYVDAQPVSAERFRKLFADHKQPGKPDDAVVDITYDEARSFAQSNEGRLLRAAEWTAASTTPGFISIDKMYEWVESPKEARQVVQHGKSQGRPDKAQKDVTFRVARDIR